MRFLFRGESQLTLSSEVEISEFAAAICERLPSVPSAVMVAELAQAKRHNRLIRLVGAGR